MALAALALFCGEARAAGPAPVISPAIERGDADALQTELLEVIRERPDTEEAKVALIRLLEVRTEADDARTGVAEALERALAQPIRDPRTRELALEVLALVHAEAGDWDAARAAVARRGLVKSWLVIGPFGYTTNAVHDRAFPIETLQRGSRIDLAEPHDGAAGQVSWRRDEVAPLEEAVVPGQRLYPSQGCAYALAQVKAPAGTKAVLTLECDGSFKAWWNGALVADVDRASGYRPRRARAEIVFGEGWNRLLVKDTQARQGVAASFTAAAGTGVVEGLAVEAAETVHPFDGTPGGLARAVTATADAAPSDPYAKALRAVVLLDDGLLPDALEMIASAESEAGAEPNIAWLHALILDRATHLPETRRSNEARARVEAVLEASPGFVPALARRALFLDHDGKPDEALEALLSLAKETPRYPAALRLASQIARREGWDAEALSSLRELIERRPRSPGAQFLLADWYWTRDNRRKAAELYEKGLGLDRSAYWAEERLASVWSQLHDEASAGRALETARALVERNPGRVSALRLLARIHRHRGEPAKAAELFAQVAELQGGNPEDLESAAEVLLERGEVAAALPHIDRALAIEPGRDRLRRLRAALTGKPEEADFSREWSVDILPTLKDVPGGEKFPKAHTVCILDQSVTRIYRDGSKTDYVHQAFKILDDAGVQRYHTLNLSGDVLELRTIGTDGKLYEPIVTDNTDEILMPKLEPGAVIEYRFRSVDPRRAHFQFDSGSFYFKDPNFIEPFLRSRYVVIVDKGFDFETIERNMPLHAEREERGETIVYTWDVKDSARIEPEPLMPEKDEILPQVSLVQRRTWDDLAEIYRERFTGRTRLTPELRAKAAEMSEGGETEEEKAHMLFRFACEHVREEGAQDEASEILSDRAGSRLILFRALLDAASVPSRFAMVGTNPRLGPVEVWDPPRPGLLDGYALVVEPRDGDPVWVFEPGRLSPYGLIPKQAQGATALLLSPSGGELATVPEAPLDESATTSSMSLILDDVNARVTGESIVREAGVYRVKEQIATTPRAQLRNFIEGQLAQVFRGARLEEFDFPAASEPGTPFTITYEAEVPDFVVEQGERYLIRAGLGPLDLTRKLAGKPKREHPMLVRSLSLQREEVEIDLGDAWDVESVPKNVLLKEAFGIYTLAYALDGAKIRVVRSFSLLPARVEPAEYPAVLRFCREVDTAERKWIELRER